MAVPKVAFDGNEVPDEAFVPPDPVPEEVFPEDDDRNVPCVCSCDCHVVLALELIAFGIMSVFSFVGGVGGSGLALQTSIFPDDEVVYISVLYSR